VPGTTMAAAQVPSLYEPSNAYKPVVADIGIVDGPFEYLVSVHWCAIQS
jgi:hypothetical protein